MSEQKANFFDQPKAVWATAFACVVGFMSIGLVDPILVSIAEGLNASPSQVSLLFTSYFFVTSVMMLITGFVSSRLGGRKTVLLGAALIVVFAALAGTSDSVAELVGFRAGWGLGNAFFVVTALSVIVAASRGGTMTAILIYEAALGLGISVGPLLGAALGSHSWRYPFFGTATLMAIAFVAILLWLPEQPKPAQKTSLTAPIRALGHSGLLTASCSAFFYYFAFFTILAFVPFVLQMSAKAVGLIFFGWGLMLAIFSVFVAPRLQSRFNALQILSVCLTIQALLLIAMTQLSVEGIAVCVVLSGSVNGICNTVYTEIALEVSDSPRPVASAGYNCVRWFAGVVAPFVVPLLAEHYGTALAFYVAAAAALIAPLVLFLRRSSLGHYGGEQISTLQVGTNELVVALAGDSTDNSVLERAIQVATASGQPVRVLHVRTFEALADGVLDTESLSRSEHLVSAARARLEKAGLSVTVEVLETAAVHLTGRILEQIESLKPTCVILGRGPERTLAHILHGSLVDGLNRRAGESIELMVVPAAGH